MSKLILDMVHNNPGEPTTYSKFLNPAQLQAYGYNGQVRFEYLHAAITYRYFDKTLLASNISLRNAIDARAANIYRMIEENRNMGIRSFFHTDFMVVPKSLLEKHKADLCDDDGRINIHRPLTQDLLRAQIQEICQRFPALDGLVVRHGETYTHDIPLFTGNGPISRGVESHVLFVNLLCEEICEKANRYLIYRTWDFQGIHTNREKYLAVSGEVETHPKLMFSVKHTQGDYWRAVPFNETLMSGKHRQVIEIQCQREYEGKGAHPNYIAKGVIEGFEEHEQLDVSGHGHCLEDIKENPLFAGIFTWSRGGGWNGPYIFHEFWIELNARVLSKWCGHRDIPEESHFFAVLTEMGVAPDDAQLIRRICLLSAQAVLRGQYSVDAAPGLYHQQILDSKSHRAYCIEDGIEVLWTRDHFLGGANEVKQTVATLYREDRVDAFLAEKSKAKELWENIVAEAEQLDLKGDPELKEFIDVSCRYGLEKFKLIELAWQFYRYDYALKNKITTAIDIKTLLKQYQESKSSFMQLKEESEICPSLYSFDYCEYVPQKGMKSAPGLEALVENIRESMR